MDDRLFATRDLVGTSGKVGAVVINAMWGSANPTNVIKAWSIQCQRSDLRQGAQFGGHAMCLRGWQ